MCGQVCQPDCLTRAVGGDPVALKLLLTHTHGRLRDYISPKIPPGVRPILDPDDLLQETYTEVFRRIETFESRGPDSFFRWLAAIALSRLRNSIKHEQTARRGGPGLFAKATRRNIEDSTIALLTMLVSPVKTPSRTAMQSEAIDAVHVAIDTLPEHYGQAVWLMYIEGLSAAEVAAEMGRTKRAVHGLCRRGLKLLKERLQNSTGLLSSTG